MKQMKKRVGYVLGVLGLLGVDWFAKYLAQVHLGDKRIPIIGEFLQLRYIVNYGMEFGLFSGNRYITMIMPVVAMIAFVALYFYCRNYLKKRNELKMIKAMNLISMLFWAGFVGNYRDRIVHGGVIDFISVKGFAVFNVADIYLTVCEILYIGMLCYQYWKESKEKKAKKAEEAREQ